jgi:hypothetical protein
MQIQITGMNEDDVVVASGLLDDAGFQYDEDYTTLYGAQWAIVGMQFSNADAAALVIEQYVVQVVV